MNKYFIFLASAVFLLTVFGLSPHAEAERLRTALANPTSTPLRSPEIEKLELDRDEVVIPCPPGLKTREGAACNDGFIIKVKSSAVNSNNAALTYQYTISGGRIIGKGANVSWDLIGVRPGVYTITATIGDEPGFMGKSITETVRVKDCEYCFYADACPSVKISTPTDAVKAGETITFTANLADGFSPDNLTFNWTISDSMIKEGQGTPTIKVETTRELAGGSLTARVELFGAGFGSFCRETTASKSVSITK